MDRTAIIIQARLGSSRLPNKVLRNLGGVAILGWIIRRLRQCSQIDEIVVATSISPKDDPIELFCRDHACLCFRGSEEDVLERFLGAAHWVKADYVVRITSDCPLIEPEIVDRMASFFLASKLDYAGCVHERSFPRGLDAEIVRVASLLRVSRFDLEMRHREHVTPYIYENPNEFKIEAFSAEGEWHRNDIRLCVDNSMDLETLEEIINNINWTTVEGVSVQEVIHYADLRPDLLSRMAATELEHNQKNLSEGVQHTIRTRDLKHPAMENLTQTVAEPGRFFE